MYVAGIMAANLWIYSARLFTRMALINITLLAAVLFLTAELPLTLLAGRESLDLTRVPMSFSSKANKQHIDYRVIIFRLAQPVPQVQKHRYKIPASP